MNDSNQPNFMLGLIKARQILLNLKQKKKSQSLNTGSNIQHFEANNNRQNFAQILQQKQEIPFLQIDQMPTLSKKDELCQKLNEIGKKLHDSYQSGETYQIVLEKLAEFYRGKMHIIEENQHLKKKGYFLHEQIKHYKDQIDQNYKQIKNINNQTQQFQRILTAQLQNYLQQQQDKASVSIHPVLKSTKCQVKQQRLNIQKDENKSQRDKISLNYKSLSQQVVRKPRIKPIVDNEAKLNAQLYNI